MYYLYNKPFTYTCLSLLFDVSRLTFKLKLYTVNFPKIDSYSFYLYV